MIAVEKRELSPDEVAAANELAATAKSAHEEYMRALWKTDVANVERAPSDTMTP